MAKKGKMKGVTCIERNGTLYWYANLGGRRTYCGKDDKGHRIAVAAKAKEIAKGYENKEVNAGLKVKKVEFKTLKDLANWYMQLPIIQQQKVYLRKAQCCTRLLQYFGSKRVNQIEPDDMDRYRQHRKDGGVCDGTVDLEVILLSAMYRLALKRKKILADSMPGEFPIKGVSVPRRIIADEEFEKLLKHADTDFADVLICGYESAMRAGEIGNLTAEQVHLNVQHISGAVVDYIDLGIFDTKNGTRRTVPVSARLKKVLERLLSGLGPEDYVFTNVDSRYENKSNRKKYTNVKVSHYMRKACKNAKVPYGDKLLNKKGERIGVVFHCLRHTRTTKWVEMGFSDEIIRRATGHKTLEAYQKYVKLDPSVVMRLVENQKRYKSDIQSPQSHTGSGL